MRRDQMRQIEHPADRLDREEAERVEAERIKMMHDAELRDAYRAVAETREGRTVLMEWIKDYTPNMAARDARGNSIDWYNLGRAYQADEIKKTLKQVLPRELFLEIIYPKEIDNGTTDDGRTG